jgi:hypothetical protein
MIEADGSLLGDSSYSGVEKALDGEDAGAEFHDGLAGTIAVQENDMGQELGDAQLTKLGGEVVRGAKGHTDLSPNGFSSGPTIYFNGVPYVR